MSRNVSIRMKTKCVCARPADSCTPSMRSGPHLQLQGLGASKREHTKGPYLVQHQLTRTSPEWPAVCGCGVGVDSLPTAQHSRPRFQSTMLETAQHSLPRKLQRNERPPRSSHHGCTPQGQSYAQAVSKSTWVGLLPHSTHEKYGRLCDLMLDCPAGHSRSGVEPKGGRRSGRARRAATRAPSSMRLAAPQALPEKLPERRGIRTRERGGGRRVSSM